MKPLFLFLYVLILFGCKPNTQINSDSNTQPDTRKYATELIDNDFLMYADSVKADSLRA